MDSASSFDSAALFNSQPHIDDIENGLVATEQHQSDVFTFMLKHKHFDLVPGEVLFVQKREKGYDVSVRLRDSLKESSPCMWLYSFGWEPFAYTRHEFGSDNSPDMPEGDYNLGMRWLNDGGTERTDEVKRIQQVRPESIKGKAITTHVNWEGTVGLCITIACKRGSEDFHVKFHIRPKE